MIARLPFCELSILHTRGLLQVEATEGIANPSADDFAKTGNAVEEFEYNWSLIVYNL